MNDNHSEEILTVEEIEAQSRKPGNTLYHQDVSEDSVPAQFAKLVGRPIAFAGRHYYNMTPPRFSEREMHMCISYSEMLALDMAVDARDVTPLAQAASGKETTSILSAKEGAGYYWVVNGRFVCRHNRQPMTAEDVNYWLSVRSFSGN